MDLLRKAWQTVQGWSRRDSAHVVVLSFIVTAAIIHQSVLWFWYIEDAAITFAYAKHVAMGEGLVPFIGGERVEGYSNPAWTFFLVPFSFVGFDLHALARWLQVILLIPTFGATYLAARETFEGTSFGPVTSELPLVAPAVLAASAQFAVWTGSGLEMALMNLFMAVAIWRSLVELRTGAFPWSALWWLGVTLSRPEAILYAAVGGFCAMVGHLKAGRGSLPTVKWLVVFFLPFGLYHAWRYNYFAWEFPNTYYGKLERRATFPLLEWTSKSWQYTRDFAFEMGWGFFLPVFTMGAIGSRGWRWPLAFGIAAGTAVLVTLVEPAQRALLPAVVLAILGVFWVGLATVEERPPKALFLAGVVVAAGLIGASELLRQGYDMAPNQIPVFDALKTVPPYALISVGVVLFAASWGARFEASRRLTTGLVLAAVLFALIAQWDWMNGYRWYAPAVVPGSLLFALGAHGFAQVLQRTFGESTQTITVSGAIAIIGLTLLTVPANVAHTQKIAAKPQTKPVHVRHRVNFVNGVRDTLHMDYERFIDLDVDQGAHLYWSDFEMLDLAGLIDVPFAQHKFEQPFVREYLFYEKVPHFIHVHGGWAGSSRIPRLKEFREGYVEIPGYIANRREFHIGNHVRRNLMLADSWPPDARVDVRGEPVRFDNDVMVHGIRVPSEPAEKGKFYVEIGVSLEVSRKRKEDNFRVWLIAERGAQHHVWDLAPTYDWITPRDWKRGEIFQGRYSLDLPEALTAGTYDLVVVVVNSDGSVAQVLGSSAGPATVATGELRYEDALTVLDATAWSKAREQDRANAIAHASASRCFEAEHAWLLARRHSGHDRAWIDEQWGELRRAFATCYAEASDAYDDPTKKVPDLVKAREHDHWAPAYRDRAREVADALMERGTASREGQDWERAYRYFADAVAVDRSRSWARRWAEEARAYRLEIDDETMAAKEAKRKADVEKRRAELKQRSKSPPR